MKINNLKKMKVQKKFIGVAKNRCCDIKKNLELDCLTA